MAIYRLSALLLLATLSTPSAAGLLWGLKTCAAGQAGCSGSPAGGGSAPPSQLFSFDAVPGALANVATVTRNGQNIDADGLAIASSGDLFAFELGTVNNQITSGLITINSSSAVATRVGTVDLNRDIRGAAFDAANKLWAIDAAQNQLLSIDSNTGVELSNVALSVSVGTTALDIAFNQAGEAYVAALNRIYSLNTGTGAMTLLAANPLLDGFGIAGLAFSGTSSDLFAYEVNSDDDIYTVDSSFTATTLLYGNIISNFNSGRGDLAAQVTFRNDIPLPGTVLLMILGLLTGRLGTRSAAHNR